MKISARGATLFAASMLASCVAQSLVWTCAVAQDSSGGSDGASAAALRVRSLAATCAQCHGTDGRGVEGAVVPGLAGMPAATFVDRMNAYKSGELSGTVMPQLAKGFDAAQIAQLATYFAGTATAIKH
jgi:cytochrome subunit of sulfide dehydrogenase